ncbi:hypothetical protein KR51_00023150 [Rubidibacter lacunae KORDI 51-2]|uniref:Uncharacterized protein n=1 Tax=Rubidibacter lacunae KORDI 51-2 TaxID=582515 RepID=U5D8Y9_9CHRO|nr:hypothetical protein KR51_00023150 [Rubidibacter lacunae KORDI 51-2]
MRDFLLGAIALTLASCAVLSQRPSDSRYEIPDEQTVEENESGVLADIEDKIEQDLDASQEQIQQATDELGAATD